MVNLSIDGGSPMTMDNFGKHYTLNSEAPLYVGGEDLACPKPFHQVMVTAIPGGASCSLACSLPGELVARPLNCGVCSRYGRGS